MLSSRNALTEEVFSFSTYAQLCFTLRVLTEKQSLLSFRNSLRKQNPHCILLLKFSHVYVKIIKGHSVQLTNSLNMSSYYLKSRVRQAFFTLSHIKRWVQKFQINESFVKKNEYSYNLVSKRLKKNILQYIQSRNKALHSKTSAFKPHNRPRRYNFEKMSNNGESTGA